MPHVRIRELRLNSFKCYSGCHSIIFDDRDFICCVGRNGSGKSCIVDAISFCFGASVHELKVNKLSDLINNDDQRKDSEVTCSVAIQLCVKLDFKESGKCIWAKRTIRGEQNASSYHLAHVKGDEITQWALFSKKELSVRLKEYNIDMICQERFIFRQLNTTSLAQSNSIALLDFCEQVIGTSQLKSQMLALEQSKMDLNEEISLSTDTCKVQQQILKKHQPMVNCFAEWIDSWDKNEKSKKSVKEELIGVGSKLLTALRIRDNALEEDIASLQHKQVKLQRRLMSRTEKLKESEQLYSDTQQQFFRMQKAAHEKCMQTSKLKAEVMSVEKEQERFKSMKQSVSGKMRTLQKDKLHYRKELESTELELRGLQNIASDKSASTTNTTSPMLPEWNCKTEQKIRSLRDKKLQQEKYTLELKCYDEKLEELDNSIQNTLRERNLMQRDIKQNNTALTSLRLEAGKARTVIEQEMEKLLQLQLTCDNARIAVESCRATEQISGSINLLKRYFGKDKVYGAVSELANVNSRYFDAVNSVMQPFLSHIAVCDRNIAIKVVQHLSKEGTGKINCFILNELEDSADCEGCCSPKSDRLELRGWETLCSAIICKATKFRRFYHNICTKWVICKDQKHAMRTAKKLKKNCVSLTGDVYHSDGIIQTYSKVMPRGTSCIQLLEGGGGITLNETSRSDQLEVILESRAEIDRINEHVKELEGSCKQIDCQVSELEKSISAQSESLSHTLETYESTKTFRKEVAELRESTSLELARLEETIIVVKENVQNIFREGNVDYDDLLCKSEMAAQKNRDLNARRVRIQKRINQIHSAIQSSENKTVEIESTLDTLERKFTLAQEKLDNISDEASEKDIRTVSADLKHALKHRKRAQSHREKILVEIDKVDRSKSGKEALKLELLSKVRCLQEQLTSYDYIESQAANCKSEGYDDGMLAETFKKLTTRLREAENEARALEAKKEKISRQALEEAKEAKNELDRCKSLISAAKSKLAEISSHQEALATERFTKLMTALQAVNNHFRAIYGSLQEDGDAYLSYSKEKIAFFAEGVVINCKPDESRWQNFLSLSGGQKVLCAISLIFALQKAFPCPIYICDGAHPLESIERCDLSSPSEVDAALDTSNVKKLATLLHKQCEETKAQFVVVSHRPELWEESNFFVGVYDYEGAARSISYVCPTRQT